MITFHSHFPSSFPAKCLYYKKHFYSIRSPAAFFNSKDFCHYCKSTVNNNFTHNCDYICFCCKQNDCRQNNTKFVKCNDCDLNCYNDICLIKHKEKKICKPKSICEKYYC